LTIALGSGPILLDLFQKEMNSRNRTCLAEGSSRFKSPPLHYNPRIFMPTRIILFSGSSSDNQGPSSLFSSYPSIPLDPFSLSLRPAVRVCLLQTILSSVLRAHSTLLTAGPVRSFNFAKPGSLLICLPGKNSCHQA